MSDTYERDLVETLIAKGRGWQSISEAVGKSIDYLRGSYDLSRQPVIIPPEEPVCQGRETISDATNRRNEMTALRELYVANDFVRVRLMPSHLRDALSRVRKAHEGITTASHGNGLKLTPAGRALYEKMRRGDA